MDKIKRFFDCSIATETCNLRCHYCYITQKRKFNNKLVDFEYPIDTMVKALSKQRLGGACLFNFCAGGETLLSEKVLPLVYALIEEGHYIMIVTNGTLTQRFEEISTWPKEILDHLFLKFSFHYLELKRLDLMQKFLDNVNLMKQSGASFTVEITPSDELIPYIEEIKKKCLEELGTMCHITVARDERVEDICHLSKYPFDKYKEIWSTFESDLFSFKHSIFYQKRKEFCYAGDWSAFLYMSNGMLQQCLCGKVLSNSIFENTDEPIPFEAIGAKCELPHCINGHAYLTLGTIPTLDSPTFDKMRNRVCADGSEWLSPVMKSFMSSKLCQSNEEYSEKEKRRINKAGKELTPLTVKIKAAVKNSLPESFVKKYDSIKHK